MEHLKKTGYVYDEIMAKHSCPSDNTHPECPERITVPFALLKDKGLLDKCKEIQSRQATDEELTLVHMLEYVLEVKNYKSTNQQQVCKVPERWPTYISDSAFEVAACAVGSTLSMVDAVMNGQVDNGVCLVRPPGHHAETNESCGFCFFNTLAVAAKYAQRKHGASKVMILDWDIHHGNGIQHIFYEDPSVLYISFHRYDNGDYFPHMKEGNFDALGSGKGEGYNVNIPWNKDKMGDADYKKAFDTIVLPIAKQFDPDLLFIASGFDAAAADPLGEYVLTPKIYGYMTEAIKQYANGKVILALEGGYNTKAIGETLAVCTEVLLGVTSGLENSINVGTGQCKRAEQTIINVKKAVSKYWTV